MHVEIEDPVENEAAVLTPSRDSSLPEVILGGAWIHTWHVKFSSRKIVSQRKENERHRSEQEEEEA